MEPRRTEQDSVHRASSEKLDAARFLNNECAYTRKSLKKYLLGHLFRFQKNRIDRHVKACARCSSEVDALRRMEETRQILKYIDLPEGVAHHVKEGVSALAKLRMILYRPLWLTAIVVAVAALSYYASQPRQLDLEIESLVTAPAGTVPAPPAEQQTSPGVATAPVTTPPAVVQAPPPQPEPVPAVEPLAVSITPDDDTSAIRRINEVMRGHGQLRKLKFSATARVLSGKLTTKELLTFFDRIEEVAKVRYNRKRLEAMPGAEPIPFVLTLKAAPKTAVPPPAQAPPPAPGTATAAPSGTAVPAPAAPAAQ